MKTILSAFIAACLICLSAQGQEASAAWTLQQCIDHALEHNIQIQQKEIQQQNAEIQLNTSKMSRLPNLNAGVDQDWNLGRTDKTQSGVYEDQQSLSTRFGISSSTPIFTGFRIRNEIEQKRLNLEAAIHGLERAREDLLLNIASFYLQVLFNKELLKVSEDQLQLSRQQEKQTQQLVDAGKVAISQLYDIRAQVASNEASVTQSENNLRLSLLDLAQNLELPSIEGFDVVVPKLGDVMSDNLSSLLPPDEIFRNALAVKPVIKEQLSLLESSRAELKIAQSGYYPQLDLNLGYNTGYYYKIRGDENKSFSGQWRDNAGQAIGLSLNIPIFNRFQVRNQVRSARLNILSQELEVENTRKALYKEIQAAYYSAVGAQQKYNAAEKAEKASREAFQFALERYEVGKLTVFEYNEALSKLTRSISEQIQAKYDYIFRSKILDFYNGVPIRL